MFACLQKLIDKHIIIEYLCGIMSSSVAISSYSSKMCIFLFSMPLKCYFYFCHLSVYVSESKFVASLPIRCAKLIRCATLIFLENFIIFLSIGNTLGATRSRLVCTIIVTSAGVHVLIRHI